MKIAKKALASLAIIGMALTMAPFNAFASVGTPMHFAVTGTTARLFGSDRFETAVAIADAGWTTANTAILAPSDDVDLVDALLAAPLAGKTAPILLTDSNALTPVTQSELIKLGVKSVYVVGALSQTVIDQVNAMSGVTATVLSGADSIAVATAISAKLSNPGGSFVIGYGALADALSIASYAAAHNYSILVANPDGSLPISEAAYKGATTYIIGGPTLVADIAGATRLYGADRFTTNQAVLNALTYEYNNVYVANGTDAHLVDSLVASSLAAQSNAPIVLTDTDIVAAATSVNSKLTANSLVTALGGHTLVTDADVAQITTSSHSSVGGGVASLGVASDLSGFIQYYPLLAGNAAPSSTLVVAGVPIPPNNVYDASRNAGFVVAPFNSYPAMSTVPSQGLTINMSSDKNGVITNVDGYTLTSMPNNATVDINSFGEVSVNDVQLWKAQSGYKVVGYMPGSISGSATLIEENLSNLTNFIGVDVPTVGSSGIQVATWTLPSTHLPSSFEEFLGFNVNSTGQLQPMVASYFANNNSFAPYSTGLSTLATGVFAPIEVAKVYASDKYSETPVITVSNSLNNQTATVTTNFSLAISSLLAVKTSPPRVNEVLGGSQNITFTCQNAYGEPIANQILYLETGIQGLWIIQVNGNNITGSVNIGTTSSPSIQTVSTPVPLFNLGAGAGAPAYSSVSVTGLNASHLNDNTSPVIVLTTGEDGTISVTLADGNVNYVANSGSTTAKDSYIVDPGTSINQQNFGIFSNSAQTWKMGSIVLNWGSSPN